MDKIDKELIDILECPICTEVMSDPRALPCQHTFCFQCIKQHANTNNGGLLSNCPVCRKTFIFVNNGGIHFTDLPRNIYIAKLAAAMERSRENREEAGGKKIEVIESETQTGENMF